MKKTYNFWVPLCAILFSSIVFWGLLEQEMLAQEYPILWTGACLSLPLLAGYVGSHLGNAFSRSTKILFPSAHPLRLVLCLAAAFGLGAGGQVLYSLSWNEVSEEVQVVFMLDGSNSMQDFQADCQEAASTIIDSLDEHYEVQVVSFASLVLDATDFLIMDDAGKAEAITFIETMDIVGGTNFDNAFQFARQSLEGKENPAVIMLTDGDAPLSDDLISDYTAANIRVYTIRIENDFALAENVDKLIGFADASGGMDTFIEVDHGGSVDQKEILAAFDEAFASSGGLVMADRLLLAGSCPEPMFVYLAVRLIVFGLFGLAAAYFHYGKLPAAYLFGNILSGMLVAVALSLTELNELAFVILMGGLLFGVLPSYREVDAHV